MVVKESPTLKIVLHIKKHSVQIEVGGVGGTRNGIWNKQKLIDHGIESFTVLLES